MHQRASSHPIRTHPNLHPTLWMPPKDASESDPPSNYICQWTHLLRWGSHRKMNQWATSYPILTHPDLRSILWMPPKDASASDLQSNHNTSRITSYIGGSHRKMHQWATSHLILRHLLFMSSLSNHVSSLYKYILSFPKGPSARVFFFSYMSDTFPD